MAGVDLRLAEREYFQQRQRLLRLLIGSDILDNGLGFSILGNDERLSFRSQTGEYLRSVRFEVTDRFDLGGISHRTVPGIGRDQIWSFYDLLSTDAAFGLRPPKRPTLRQEDGSPRVAAL